MNTKTMKNNYRYYLLAVFFICLATIALCGMLTVEEKGAAMLFGKETQTIQLNVEQIGIELRSLF